MGQADPKWHHSISFMLLLSEETDSDQRAPFSNILFLHYWGSLLFKSRTSTWAFPIVSVVAGSLWRFPVGGNTVWGPLSECTKDNQPFHHQGSRLHTAVTPNPPSPAFLGLGENKGRSSSSKNWKLNHLLSVKRAYKANLCKVNHTPLCLVSWFVVYWVIATACLLINSYLPMFFSIILRTMFPSGWWREAPEA